MVFLRPGQFAKKALARTHWSIQAITQSLIPLKSHRQELRILLLHDVDRPSFEKLRETLTHLLATSEFIHPNDVGNTHIYCSSNIKRKLLLTFDDGYKSNYHFAREVLDPLGIKALFFVCPDFISCTSLSQAHAFINNRLYPYAGHVNTNDLTGNMSWSHLRELSANGHVIGSHTISHPRLSSLDADKVKAEITDSANKIQQELSYQISHFAYPFGDHSSINSLTIHEASLVYKYIYTGIRGANTAQTSHLGLYRDSFTPCASTKYVDAVLDGYLDLLYLGDRYKYEKKIAQSFRMGSASITN